MKSKMLKRRDGNVERIVLDAGRSQMALARARWTYWRPEAEGVVELGTLHGRDVGLPTHFHDEHQITFVLAGRRRFVMGDGIVDLAAGQGALIPAGVPHSSVAEPDGVVCLNAYVPAGAYAVTAMLAEIARLRRSREISAHEFAAVIRAHRETDGLLAHTAPLHDHGRETVGTIAARMGMSREGFSRMFSRRSGMPPHAFQLASRLNHARRLLRAGDTIAAVAADTGFTDQSHFGRWFRRLFGVTPGRYRLG